MTLKLYLLWYIVPIKILLKAIKSYIFSQFWEVLFSCSKCWVVKKYKLLHYLIDIMVSNIIKEFIRNLLHIFFLSDLGSYTYILFWSKCSKCSKKNLQFIRNIFYWHNIFIAIMVLLSGSKVVGRNHISHFPQF